MLPENLSPFLRYLIYGLLFLHIFAFLAWAYMLRKSLGTTPQQRLKSEAAEIAAKKKN
jgi:hypothetical protein